MFLHVPLVTSINCPNYLFHLAKFYAVIDMFDAKEFILSDISLKLKKWRILDVKCSLTHMSKHSVFINIVNTKEIGTFWQHSFSVNSVVNLSVLFALYAWCHQIMHCIKQCIKHAWHLTMLTNNAWLYQTMQVVEQCMMSLNNACD